MSTGSHGFPEKRARTSLAWARRDSGRSLRKGAFNEAEGPSLADREADRIPAAFAGVGAARWRRSDDQPGHRARLLGSERFPRGVLPCSSSSRRTSRPIPSISAVRLMTAGNGSGPGSAWKRTAPMRGPGGSVPGSDVSDQASNPAPSTGTSKLGGGTPSPTQHPAPGHPYLSWAR